MNFLWQLTGGSRLLSVLFDNLPNTIKDSTLYKQVATYVEKYADFNKITAEQAIDIYMRYITVYNKHCKYFIKHAKYPREGNLNDYSISREEYDLVLLLSVLFTQHRFRIMELIHQQPVDGKGLFIGAGPGLEIALSIDKLNESYCFDLSSNKFLFAEFPMVTLNTELYNGQKKNYFNTIFLIELLEHLTDPYPLLEICASSLKNEGLILLTTASDVPQFDHLFNFPKDHSKFEERLALLGLDICYKEMILHHFLTLDFQPCNHFYVVKKINQ